MQRLTILRMSGDPGELLASKREHIDPVMKRKADQYGHLLHVAARSDDGIVVINLWESEEGSQQAWEDPKLQKAREAAGRNGASTRETTFEHSQVADYRQGSS